MSDLDYEYLLTVKKLDHLLQKKEKKMYEDLLLNENLEENIIDNYEEKREGNTDVKKEFNSREDDLFQEIYGKFNGNYAELVEDYVQTLIKFENRRIKRAYFFGFLFCIISLSLAVLFSNVIPI